MTPIDIRKALVSIIQNMGENKEHYVREPGRDFCRKRKLPFETMLATILGMGGSSLTNELLDCFGCAEDVASTPAFIQQRAKILPKAFESLFQSFAQIRTGQHLYKDYQLLAIDGSDLLCAPNKTDPDSYFPGANGQRPYNLLHLNALYDLLQHTYLDAVIQKRRCQNEHTALVDMVDRSPVQQAILLADRGFESYNNLAHIQEKGWKYLIRIKNGKPGIICGFDLPDSDEFDLFFPLLLFRRNTREAKALSQDKNRYRYVHNNSRFDFLPTTTRKHDPFFFYELPIRIIRFKIANDTSETIVTNLDADDFPPGEVKRLYALRWGIETSFRDLKYTIGLLHFHSKKPEYLFQEIFARLTMYNFSELITSTITLQQADRKYCYKVNFSVAAYICRKFFHGNISQDSINILLSKFISPIRPGRKRPRKMCIRPNICFVYRVA